MKARIRGSVGSQFKTWRRRVRRYSRDKTDRHEAILFRVVRRERKTRQEKERQEKGRELGGVGGGGRGRSALKAAIKTKSLTK